MRDLDLGKRGDAFWCYAYGLAYASVCSSLDPESTAAEMNQRHTDSPFPHTLVWRLSDDPKFKGGEPQPGACEDFDTHRHYLLEC